MPTATDIATPSKARLWTGRVLTTLATLFLVFDGVMKLFQPQPVTQAMTQLGFPPHLSVPIGIILLVCTLLYVLPQTAVFGAVLLTGYLGGAIVVQMRIDAPLLSTTLFPIYFAVLLWAGIYLREPRLRALIPIRS
jgi:DoxX-like protein